MANACNPQIFHLVDPLLINNKNHVEFLQFSQWKAKLQISNVFFDNCLLQGRAFFFGEFTLSLWRLQPFPLRSTAPKHGVDDPHHDVPPESEGKHGQRRQTLGQFLKKKTTTVPWHHIGWAIFGVENQLVFWKQLDFFPQKSMESWITRSFRRWGPRPQQWSLEPPSMILGERISIE